MKKRCLHSGSEKYKYYGARGITVAPEWMIFENFLADMEEKPSPELTLERVDVNKGYSKENCCWATQITQTRNRRYTKLTFPAAELIRRMYASGLFTQAELAIEFNISEGHVPSIINKKYWAAP